MRARPVIEVDKDTVRVTVQPEGPLYRWGPVAAGLLAAAQTAIVLHRLLAPASGIDVFLGTLATLFVAVCVCAAAVVAIHKWAEWRSEWAGAEISRFNSSSQWVQICGHPGGADETDFLAYVNADREFARQLAFDLVTLTNTNIEAVPSSDARNEIRKVIVDRWRPVRAAMQESRAERRRDFTAQLLNRARTVGDEQSR